MDGKEKSGGGKLPKTTKSACSVQSFGAKQPPAKNVVEDKSFGFKGKGASAPKKMKG